MLTVYNIWFAITCAAILGAPTSLFAALFTGEWRWLVVTALCSAYIWVLVKR